MRKSILILLSRLGILSILLIMGNISNSQASDILIKTKVDTNYIKDYSESLNVKLFGVTKSNEIFHYDNFTQENIQYKPNENFNIGLGFVYKWLGLDLAFNLPIINNDDQIYGQTKRFDIQMNLYLRKFVFDIHYQKYKGYYGTNAWIYSDEYKEGELNFPLRPDMRTFNTAINALYVFNSKKFSYRAAFIYSERQLKSAGSFIAGSYFNYFTMNADKPIVPESEILNFNLAADFRGAKYISAGLSGGYGRNFIIGKKFFISLSLVLGMGPTFIHVPERNGESSYTKTEFAVRGVVRTAFGFNSEKAFWGVSAVGTNFTEVDIEESRLSRSVNNFKIFYGRRLGAPGFLKKLGDSPF